MWRTFLLTAFLVGVLPASAAAMEEPVAVESEPIPLPYPKAKSLRTTGIVVSSPGIFLGTLGAGLMIGGAASMGQCGESAPDCNVGPAFMVVGGGLSATLAVPFLGVGIPMWAVGHKRVNANEAAGQVTLTVQPMEREGAGLTLAGRF